MSSLTKPAKAATYVRAAKECALKSDGMVSSGQVAWAAHRRAKPHRIAHLETAADEALRESGMFDRDWNSTWGLSMWKLR